MEKIRGVGRTIAASVTRPANTTAYVAGQVFGANLKFPTAFLGNAEVLTVMGATLIDEANQTTKPSLELWLFDTNPTTFADQATFAPTNTDMEALVGIIALPSASFVVGNSGAGAAGNCACDAQAIFLYVNAKATDTSLYGVLVVRNAYTPVSAEKIVVRLKVVD